jgi:hypothetical protein
MSPPSLLLETMSVGKVACKSDKVDATQLDSGCLRRVLCKRLGITNPVFVMHSLPLLFRLCVCVSCSCVMLSCVNRDAPSPSPFLSFETINTKRRVHHHIITSCRHILPRCTSLHPILYRSACNPTHTCVIDVLFSSLSPPCHLSGSTVLLQWYHTLSLSSLLCVTGDVNKSLFSL